MGSMSIFDMFGLLHLYTLLLHVVSGTKSRLTQESQPCMHRQTGTRDHACQPVCASLQFTNPVWEILMSCDLLQTLQVGP